MPATWRGRSHFTYTGSIELGTKITYGEGNNINVSAEQYAALREQFINQTIEVGTSRTNVPRRSLGKYLQDNVTRTAIASYVAPILVLEGFAERIQQHKIRIIK